jgi:hypothetical protein
MRPLSLCLVGSVAIVAVACHSTVRAPRPDDEVLGQEVRAYGVVMRLPVDAERDRTVDVRSAFHSRTLIWNAARVRVTLSLCTEAPGPDGCSLGGRLPGIERESWRDARYRFRSFERIDDGHPVRVAWVTGPNPTSSSTITVIGTTAEDSSLVRAIALSLRYDRR